jgi:hypothetical protein
MYLFHDTSCNRMWVPLRLCLTIPPRLDWHYPSGATDMRQYRKLSENTTNRLSCIRGARRIDSPVARWEPLGVNRRVADHTSRWITELHRVPKSRNPCGSNRDCSILSGPATGGRWSFDKRSNSSASSINSRAVGSLILATIAIGVRSLSGSRLIISPVGSS